MHEVYLSLFNQAIQTLIKRVNHAKGDESRLVEKLPEQPAFKRFDWLEALPIFPKFYWQSRDTREEVIALGQIHIFTDPSTAYSVITGEQRIWGGSAFDTNTGKQKHCMPSFFFLPQVELFRQGKEWSLIVNITSQKHLIINTLNKLMTDAPILPILNAHICHTAHMPNKYQWHNLVGSALNRIQHKEFKKVVLARRTTLTLNNPVSATQLLKASYEQNHHSFHFMLSLNANHSFIGSTPERLYQQIGKQIQTEALAGTIGRGVNATQDIELANWLSQDQKNLNENQYVVDDIIERLKPYTNNIQVEQQAHLIRLSKVQHLKRHIQATLKPAVNGAQLLKTLQATAAVAGLPHHDAMHFIQKNEPFNRGWYAGSMGYISHQQAEFCVAIRSALVLQDQIQLFAGAGIVPGSIAEHEWQELDKKMSTLLSLISGHPSLDVAS